MKIIITGANGFIGRSLSTRLSAINHFSIFTPETFKFKDVIELNENLRNIDTIIHLAARVHIMRDTDTDPLAAFRKTNTEQTLEFAHKAAEVGIKRFIFISSIKVNGEMSSLNKPFTTSDIPNPIDPYGISKMEAELGLHELAMQTGMEVVIIRPPLVYGPGVKANFAALIRAVQRGIPLPLGSIQNQRSLVSLDNLIDLITVCITHPKAANQTFLVSDGHDLSTPDLIRGIADAAGVPARLFPMPTWALQMSGNLLGKGDAVQRLSGNLQVDISKARDLLGWTPPLSVEEGLKRAVGNIEK